MKQLVWIGLIVGSTIGGYVPRLFGGQVFSMSSVLLSTLGGIIGIAVDYKIGKDYF